MKHRLNIRIDESLVKKAEETYLNLTKKIEELLKNDLESLRRDLNPRPSAYKAIDWIQFHKYLEDQKLSKQWISTVIGNAKRYGSCLDSGDYSAIRDLPITRRPNALKGVSQWAGFLGRSSEFDKGRADFKIGWRGRSTTEIFLGRFEKTKSRDELFDWVKLFKHKMKMRKKRAQAYCLFADLVGSTGLRLGEAVACWNILVNEGLDNYYNPAQSGLEHWKYKEVFLRPHKNAFFSFVKQDFIENIADEQPFGSAGSVVKATEKVGLPSRFGDLRELHGTFMLSWLNSSEVDFLHGRISKSVFMTNYYNPNLMVDLKSRAIRGINAYMEKTKL